MVQRTHLTDKTIQNLKATTQTYVWDTQLKGFGVRIGPNRRAFVVVRNGRRKTLGLYPLMSLAEARHQALHVLYARYAPKTAPGTTEAIETYLRAIDARPRTVRDYTRLLNRHLAPIGGTLDTVTTSRIVKILDDLKDTPSEARHTHAALKTFFTWAAARDHIQTNPMQNLPPPSSANQRDRLLTDDEVRKIWSAATGDFGRLIKICVLTGMRRSEVAKMQEGWINTKAAISDGSRALEGLGMIYLTIPAEIAKNHRECVLPITPQLLPLLQPLPFKNFHWSKEKAALDKACGVTNWVIHDTRRFFSSLHARIRTPIDIQEALLNHVTGSRTQIQRTYDRYDRWEEKCAAMDAYVRAFTKLLNHPPS